MAFLDLAPIFDAIEPELLTALLEDYRGFVADHKYESLLRPEETESMDSEYHPVSNTAIN